MSNPKAKSFMQELDAWSDASVIDPLYQAFRPLFENDDEASYARAATEVKKAIRTKVLESYHNGQGARKERS